MDPDYLPDSPDESTTSSSDSEPEYPIIGELYKAKQSQTGHFTLKPEFLSVLQQLPQMDMTKQIFTYQEICFYLAQYMLEKQHLHDYSLARGTLNISRDHTLTKAFETKAFSVEMISNILNRITQKLPDTQLVENNDPLVMDIGQGANNRPWTRLEKQKPLKKRRLSTSPEPKQQTVLSVPGVFMCAFPESGNVQEKIEADELCKELVKLRDMMVTKTQVETNIGQKAIIFKFPVNNTKCMFRVSFDEVPRLITNLEVNQLGHVFKLKEITRDYEHYDTILRLVKAKLAQYSQPPVVLEGIPPMHKDSFPIYTAAHAFRNSVFTKGTLQESVENKRLILIDLYNPLTDTHFSLDISPWKIPTKLRYSNTGLMVREERPLKPDDPDYKFIMSVFNTETLAHEVKAVPLRFQVDVTLHSKPSDLPNVPSTKYKTQEMYPIGTAVTQKTQQALAKKLETRVTQKTSHIEYKDQERTEIRIKAPASGEQQQYANQYAVGIASPNTGRRGLPSTIFTNTSAAENSTHTRPTVENSTHTPAAENSTQATSSAAQNSTQAMESSNTLTTDVTITKPGQTALRIQSNTSGTNQIITRFDQEGKLTVTLPQTPIKQQTPLHQLGARLKERMIKKPEESAQRQTTTPEQKDEEVPPQRRPNVTSVELQRATIYHNGQLIRVLKNPPKTHVNGLTTHQWCQLRTQNKKLFYTNMVRARDTNYYVPYALDAYIQQQDNGPYMTFLLERLDGNTEQDPNVAIIPLHSPIIREAMAKALREYHGAFPNATPNYVLPPTLADNWGQTNFQTQIVEKKKEIPTLRKFAIVNSAVAMIKASEEQRQRIVTPQPIPQPQQAQTVFTDNDQQLRTKMTQNTDPERLTKWLNGQDLHLRMCPMIFLPPYITWQEYTQIKFPRGTIQYWPVQSQLAKDLHQTKPLLTTEDLTTYRNTDPNEIHNHVVITENLPFQNRM